MVKMHAFISPDEKKVRLEFLGPQPYVLRFEAASELDQFIEALIDVRQRMEPPLELKDPAIKPH